MPSRHAGRPCAPAACTKGRAGRSPWRPSSSASTRSASNWATRTSAGRTSSGRCMTMPSRSHPEGGLPPHFKYLAGYPPQLLMQVQQLIDSGKLGESLARRYPERHTIQSDTALYDYVMDLKTRHMRNADPINKVAYDSKLKVLTQALGTHTAISRVQGGKLKAKREIRIASLFRDRSEEHTS